jgi:hypothetical protein
MFKIMLISLFTAIIADLNGVDAPFLYLLGLVTIPLGAMFDSKMNGGDDDDNEGDDL